MIWTIDTTAFLFLASIQIFGLFGLVASRLGEKCGRHSLCQCTFFVAMIVVAISIIVALLVGSGAWAISGTTLGLMVVGATLDCGRWHQVRPCQ
ncbi:MAG: hypothetical protein P8N76_28900 [Pirellulaceae bacterium]|nr:hypothetical protein [Pirellulaceae bacterium]